ncbi:MAG: ABC transporter ATP-binding protein, partial [Candidatus Eisenbacteria bacterium]
MSELDEDLPGRSYDGRLMRRLLSYLRPYRERVALAVLVALGESLVQLAGPYLTKEAIDNGIRHRDLAHLD